MKTFNCWLIANVLPYVVAISCYFAIGGLGLRMNCFSFWDYFVVFGCGGIFSIIVRFIHIVISRKFFLAVLYGGTAM